LTYLLTDSELVVCGGGGFKPDSARAKLEREFLAMERDFRGSAFADIPGDGPHLVMEIGHVNFAQYLWNELSALEEWMSGASDQAIAGLTIVPRFEPLGPLDEIFPRLKKAQFFRASLQNQNSFLETARLIVRPSSRIVSRGIRERIVEYCGAQPMAHAWPRVWISVRTGSRTPDNQAEFIVATIGKILQAYPDAEFLLDGFSFPMDIDHGIRHAKSREGFKEKTREAFKARSRDCDAAIERTIGATRRILGSPSAARISSVSGIAITDAIAAAGTCHYYICHSGTLQHKIGWLHKIPGIIHSPTISRSWYAAQVEDGITPDELPMEFIAPSAIPTTALNLRRNFNYVITDVDKAADSIVATMKKRL
jgi:hypothetical protein